jgi:hypothetical protein
MNPAMEVNSYEIRVCRFTDCVVRYTNSTSIFVKGLQQHTAYKPQVRAINKRSNGPWAVLRQVVYTFGRYIIL